jgi:hypothetical protein
MLVADHDLQFSIDLSDIQRGDSLSEAVRQILAADLLEPCPKVDLETGALHWQRISSTWSFGLDPSH